MLRFWDAAAAFVREAEIFDDNCHTHWPERLLAKGGMHR